MRHSTCAVAHLTIIAVTCLPAITCSAQSSSKSAAHPIVLRAENNSDPIFFTSERAFDLMCDILAQGHFDASDFKVVKKQLEQHVKAGTRALELSRESHYRKVKTDWIGKSKVRITSGLRVGQEGWVFSKWVIPTPHTAQTSVSRRKTPINEGVLWDETNQFAVVCKSYRVLELAMRGFAGEELSETEKRTMAKSAVIINRPTRCNIIEVREGSRLSNGKSWGYAHIEVLEGSKKGLRGYVVDDQVKKK